MRNRLMMVMAAVVIVVTLTQFFFLYTLLEVNFRMSFLLVRPGKFTSTGVTTEGLFASVRSDVSCQVI